ncbi:MAG: hypothetical protein AB7S38_40615 [Vulcanimicrobiota bacterium]
MNIRPTAEAALRRMLTPSQTQRIQSRPRSFEDMAQLSGELADQLQVSTTDIKAGVTGVGFRGQAMARIAQQLTLMVAAGALASPLGQAIEKAGVPEFDQLLTRLGKEEPQLHAQAQLECLQGFGGLEPSAMSLTILRTPGDEFTGLLRPPDPAFWG